jgi:hypothetical protein
LSYFFIVKKKYNLFDFLSFNFIPFFFTEIKMAYRISKPKIILSDTPSRTSQRIPQSSQRIPQRRNPKVIIGNITSNDLEDISGAGFFNKLKENVKKYGSAILDVVGKAVKPASFQAYQKIANSLRTTGRKLELGELHPGNYNYMGPGTNIEKYSYIRPINALDNIARTHDIAYSQAKSLPPRERALAVSRADAEMLREMSKLDLSKYPFGNIARQVILGKYSLEKFLSLLRNQPTTLYS